LNPDAGSARLHAEVYGLVQGVGFRMFVRAEALQLGVVGWVRNRWDDSVELVAEGDRARLEALLAALQRGPLGAEVERVDEEWLPTTGEFKQFGVIPTY
jgi:acylphosphatase